MAISAAEVKKLKDMTNAGMMDCKKALEDASGDMDKALKILKEKGLADAKKRTDRETKEGGVFIKQKDNKLSMILLGCETDFVSGNEIFKTVKDKILDAVIKEGKEDASVYNDLVQEIVSQTKENVELKKVKFISLKDNQIAQTYIHGNNKIGVAAIFEVNKPELKSNKDFIEMATDVCLHITAQNPFYLNESDVPAADIEEQKALFTKQMEGSGKPANVLENIFKGKIAKFLSEICLVSQAFVKDDKISVSQYVQNASKKLGAEIKIVAYYRYMIGA